MLGDKIRKIRKAENLTVAGLAEKAGVSGSYISQLERGLVDPSVSLLRKIACCLNVSVRAFFDDEGEAPIVTRLAEREKVCTGDGSISFSWISPEADGLKMEMVEVEFAAGLKRNVHGQPRCVCLFITEGSLHISYADMDSELLKGDSIFIPSDTEFQLANNSVAVAKGILCTAKGADCE